jgi:hypothetical protein
VRGVRMNIRLTSRSRVHSVHPSFDAPPVTDARAFLIESSATSARSLADKI